MNEVMPRTSGVRTLVSDIRDVEDVVPYKACDVFKYKYRAESSTQPFLFLY